MAIETYFKNIADAIRTKAGTSGLITPAQMPQAIADIPSGGSGITFESPIHEDNHNGYIASNSGNFVYQNNNNNMADIYLLQPNHLYITFKKTKSNRYRMGLFSSDPALASTDMAGCSNFMGYRYQYANTIYYVDDASYIEYFVPYVQTTSYQQHMSNMIKNPPFTDPNGNYPYLMIFKSNSGELNIKTYLLDITNV